MLRTYGCIVTLKSKKRVQVCYRYPVLLVGAKWCSTDGGGWKMYWYRAIALSTQEASGIRDKNMTTTSATQKTFAWMAWVRTSGVTRGYKEGVTLYIPETEYLNLQKQYVSICIEWAIVSNTPKPFSVQVLGHRGQVWIIQTTPFRTPQWKVPLHVSTS